MRHCAARDNRMSLAPRYEAVIFDLDGTLIDSAPGILGCFDRILHDAGMKPLLPLNEKLIGPPLRNTLITLTGIDSAAELDNLTDRFRNVYDTEGYKATRVYDGIEEMLAALHSGGIPMSIATNKRRTPTLKILEYLEWERYFPTVGTLDTPGVPHTEKSALIGSLLKEIGADAATTLYMGDTQADGEAARANCMPFVFAGWGYGVCGGNGLMDGWEYLISPVDLFRI